VSALDDFVESVAGDDPVRVVGGRTQWVEGGSAPDGVRDVRAPVGVVERSPAEMTVRVGAGTTVAALDEDLADVGQCVALPAWDGATVGGVLSVGRSGVRRLGYGPVRDAVLELRVATADGRAVTAGGPTVKNVSGFDLPRLLVGSLGTLALVGEAVLRTRPVPARSVWLHGEGVDAFAVPRALHRPTSVLWDGVGTWVLIEGTAAQVAAQSEVASRLGLVDEVDGPPSLPTRRTSFRPRELRMLPGSVDRFVAEVGVGVVHSDKAVDIARPPHDPTVVGLHRRLKARFDPTGRLNPGRDPLRVVA
jgi:glycolate oxidase FAD binding subunit